VVELRKEKNWRFDCLSLSGRDEKGNSVARYPVDGFEGLIRKNTHKEKSKQCKRQQRHRNNTIRPKGNITGGKTHQKRKREKGKNRVSLAHNISQGGNGLLHLIHIPSRELEHWRD